jgi:hypothetical protein
VPKGYRLTIKKLEANIRFQNHHGFKYKTCMNSPVHMKILVNTENSITAKAYGRSQPIVSRKDALYVMAVLQ